MKVKQSTDMSVGTVRKKGFMFYLKRDWQLYTLLLLPMLFIIVFKFLPMLGLSLAFMDYNIFTGEGEIVGFDVFKKIFAMRDFREALRNTLLLNGLDLVLGFPAPIILAIFLNEIRCKWFKRTTQTLLYLPHFISWAIISSLAYQLFMNPTGYINIMLTRGGMDAIPFLTEKYHWLVSYVLIGVWQSMGWGTIIYLAAITGISGDLYEAATVDGAGRWRKIWNITLPCIRPTIVVMLIMALGRIMGSTLERPFTLRNYMAPEFSNVIATFVYERSQGSDYSIATAVGMFQSVIGLILVFASDRFSKAMGETGIV